MTKRKPYAGTRWAIQFDDLPPDRGVMFGPVHKIASGDYVPNQMDEITIDNWFHLEAMNGRDYWMSVGGVHLNVTVGPDGRATLVNVSVEEPSPSTEVRFE